MANLIAACVAFVGSHFLLSHPWRDPLVTRLGGKPFLGVYSLVALATFVWIIFAARALPETAPLWLAGEWMWAAASIVMLFASILLAGSFFGNPAMPEVKIDAAKQPRGVFAITRHPMMWGFALWGFVHIAVWPTPGVIVVAATMIILALGGSAGQDAKKARLMGAGWQAWVSRTGFVPFTGPAPLRTMFPGLLPLVLGAAIWLAATWAHQPLATMTIWPWG